MIFVRAHLAGFRARFLRAFEHVSGSDREVDSLVRPQLIVKAHRRSILGRPVWALSLGLIAMSGGAFAQPDCGLYDYRAEVVRVIDGDTVSVAVGRGATHRRKTGPLAGSESRASARALCT